MAVPNLSPGYLGQVKGIRAQREENEKQRAFDDAQGSKNFLRRLGGDVLGAALNIGGDIAGSAFRDSLTKNERAAAAGTYYPDDDVMGDSSAAIRSVAESRAATELRPEASYGGGAETSYGRRAPDFGPPALGGGKADVLRSQPAPMRAPTPAPTPSNPMLTPDIEAQFGRVLNAPLGPPAIPRRDLADETPRRSMAAPLSPMAAPPSPVAQRAAPMPPREMREAPGGYQPPRMMPSTTAAIARETGYRDAIPSMPTSVRGLAQQSQDVRDERMLSLELQRKKLLWEEQQAAANVSMLEQRGASATAIAAARAKEADAKAKAEEMRELDLLMSARSRGAPKYVRGLGVYTPPQTVLPTGNTDDGLRGDIVPQGPMGRQGGTGGRRGGGQSSAGAGEDTGLDGDAMTIVVQKRDKKGNPTGPSQPLRIAAGPALFRAVAAAPIDHGFETAEDIGDFKSYFRGYNEAAPGQKKGDAEDVSKFNAARDNMIRLITTAQSKYAPAVAGTREGFGTSLTDVARAARVDESRITSEARAEAGRVTQERRERAGAVAKSIPAVTEGEVTVGDVAQIVKGDPSIGAGFGNYVASVGEGLLDQDQFNAAIRGANAPSDLDGPDLAAYNAIRTKAAETRERLENERRNKTRATVGTAAAAAGMTREEVAADLEAQGLPIPEYLRPRAGAAPSRPASSGIVAKSASELATKINALPGLTGAQKEALYNREAAARGWE